MVKRFVAYEGSEFTIEWYYNQHGKSSALEYFEKLTRSSKKKIAHLFFALGDAGKIYNKEKFRHEGNQIYALKTSQDRFLCFFFKGSKVILTNAYEKKSKKMPQREKAKALNSRKTYKKRCLEETYYE